MLSILSQYIGRSVDALTLTNFPALWWIHTILCASEAYTKRRIKQTKLRDSLTHFRSNQQSYEVSFGIEELMSGKKK
jgi:hypothetical protein